MPALFAPSERTIERGDPLPRLPLDGLERAPCRGRSPGRRARLVSSGRCSWSVRVEPVVLDVQVRPQLLGHGPRLGQGLQADVPAASGRRTSSLIFMLDRVVEQEDERRTAASSSPGGRPTAAAPPARRAGRPPAAGPAPPIASGPTSPAAAAGRPRASGPSPQGRRDDHEPGADGVETDAHRRPSSGVLTGAVELRGRAAHAARRARARALSR